MDVPYCLIIFSRNCAFFKLEINIPLKPFSQFLWNRSTEFYCNFVDEMHILLTYAYSQEILIWFFFLWENKTLAKMQNFVQLVHVLNRLSTNTWIWMMEKLSSAGYRICLTMNVQILPKFIRLAPLLIMIFVQLTITNAWHCLSMLEHGVCEFAQPFFHFRMIVAAIPL